MVRPVGDDQWGVVAWLWQDFRHDLGTTVHGFPYADGRYQHALLDSYPRPDGAGYLAWQPHPRTGEDAPVAFALVSGMGGDRRTMDAFFVVPAARRAGLGRRLALDVVERHPGRWEVGFQHDNEVAGEFWRRVAAAAWGNAWTEVAEPVPDTPDVPPDHWIRST
jgi:predicted acetyltransferase